MALYRAKEVWTGTLASSIPDGTTTSFTLTSSSGLTNGETYVFTIDRVDVNGTKTPSKKEVIIGTVSGSNVINCIRGVEGTAQAHPAGAIVEILFTAKHWNDFIDSYKSQHREDGSHSKIQGLDNNQAITQKDSGGTARSVVKVNSSNVLEIGDSNLSGQQFNTPLVNNTAIKQKDSGGTARSVVKVNSSNVLEIGDSNLSGQQFNTPLVNNTAIKQKDSGGTAREILKVDNNNKLIVGNDNLTTSLKLKIFTATQNTGVNSSTNTLVDLPGASLDLEAGTYLVIANFESARVWTSSGTPPRVVQARYCVRDSDNNVLLNCWDTIAQSSEVTPREIGKVLVGVITLSSPKTIKMSGYINVQNGTNFASGFRIDSGTPGVQWSSLTAIRLT
jgi:hypothetical protein